MKKSNNKLLLIVAIVFAAVVLFWLFGNGMEPIEDTNGSEDLSLTTITDENIINLDLGSINPISVQESSFEIGGFSVSDGVEFSSKNFSGVYEVMYGNFILNSEVVFTLHNFVVEEGNFKMCVVYNDEIVAVLEPGETVEYRMEDVNGTVSLRIAGESASYSFMMSSADYDTFDHP